MKIITKLLIAAGLTYGSLAYTPTVSADYGYHSDYGYHTDYGYHSDWTDWGYDYDYGWTTEDIDYIDDDYSYIYDSAYDYSDYNNYEWEYDYDWWDGYEWELES